MRNKKFRKHLYRIERSMEKLCNEVLKDQQKAAFEELLSLIVTYKLNEFGASALDSPVEDTSEDNVSDEVADDLIKKYEEHQVVEAADQSPPDED